MPMNAHFNLFLRGEKGLMRSARIVIEICDGVQQISVVVNFQSTDFIDYDKVDHNDASDGTG